MNRIVSLLNKGLPLVIIGLMLMGCGGGDAAQVVSQAPITAKVASARTATEAYINAGSGPITAVNSAALSTRMMGFVDRIPVKVGQKVNKGQLLLSIKNTDLQAKRAQIDASIIEAKAAYQNAEKDYQRFVNLFGQNSASQKELDDMTSRYEMAKARYQAAQQMRKEVDAQFVYANIRAPFGGVITNTHIDEGAMANPGMPLVSLEAPGSYEIEAKVAEGSINQLKVGAQASVFVKALDTTVRGKLTELSPSAQFSGGQYIAKVTLNDPPEQLLSGMFATVSFEVEGEPLGRSRVSVPKSSLVKHGQLIGIYTLGPNDTAILRWLRLGETVGEEVEVLSGLVAGETYILSAEGKLYNGAKLTIK
ncbi:efflux RND transporter periplasmic adaptor subunit [Allomuricauda sp. SCSIO 65647]|uniref:efflux RND transporter periplasmic adaptor subunit n=1 Tax=Allomuricauda sp. SCSIO 65647 TaxID=2908843 RepID=UPI001F482F6A|nr:efflux RND transporter periplasmic adaptor subunit [Muricauda sp. SCSIO 65647]UJH68757.1 efflux RND transporter periplasmic adaptor subunit [Muricauda sp. SCSIO 65647]